MTKVLGERCPINRLPVMMLNAGRLHLPKMPTSTNSRAIPFLNSVHNTVDSSINYETSPLFYEICRVKALHGKPQKILKARLCRFFLIAIATTDAITLTEFIQRGLGSQAFVLIFGILFLTVYIGQTNLTINSF